MNINHILKSGEVLEDITGYVVTAEACPAAYALIDRLNREKVGKNETKDKKQAS